MLKTGQKSQLMMTTLPSRYADELIIKLQLSNVQTHGTGNGREVDCNGKGNVW